MVLYDEGEHPSKLEETGTVLPAGLAAPRSCSDVEQGSAWVRERGILQAATCGSLQRPRPLLLFFLSLKACQDIKDDLIAENVLVLQWQGERQVQMHNVTAAGELLHHHWPWFWTFWKYRLNDERWLNPLLGPSKVLIHFQRAYVVSDCVPSLASLSPSCC